MKRISVVFFFLSFVDMMIQHFTFSSSPVEQFSAQLVTISSLFNYTLEIFTWMEVVGMTKIMANII